MAPFDFHALRLRLDERAFVEQAAAVVLPSIDSTSEYLRAHWPAQAAAGASWSICVAETQTAGRGRHGHHWCSEPGAGLWFSCAVPVVPWTAEVVPPLSSGCRIRVDPRAECSGFRYPAEMAERSVAA